MLQSDLITFKPWRYDAIITTRRYRELVTGPWLRYRVRRQFFASCEAIGQLRVLDLSVLLEELGNENHGFLRAEFDKLRSELAKTDHLDIKDVIDKAQDQIDLGHDKSDGAEGLRVRQD